MAVLHKKVADTPVQEPGYLPKAAKPVKWGKPFARLSEDQAEHAWFTDGSAKYVVNTRQWNAASFNLNTKDTDYNRNRKNKWTGYLVAHMAVTPVHDTCRGSLGKRSLGTNIGNVFYVDAYCNTDLLDLFNSIADEQAKIAEASMENPNSLLGLANWAHQKCVHLGEIATHRWEQQRDILVPLDLIKIVIW
ncbi:Hypothetical predicted protein [Pelobates cultripes]|uniref:Uncharacterized protein n=1 Tax=Pelobates cultripes TaxID=61616 RepID=A0AAD1REB1_PELCU|nr:Hypothetical predicted protein [Pelobates cultripes]